ncbi:hypothetical protein HY213_01465 [Candidatus Peregrinibacteria bacterium]|nr:hypothetical protein [Candidatus Peregrinibacteria bacterium]
MKKESSKASPLERSATVRAKDLPATERRWIAAVLHVDLADDDEFTVILHRPIIHVPSPAQRDAAREGLSTVLNHLHERMSGANEEEVDAAIEDSFRDMRSRKL